MVTGLLENKTENQTQDRRQDLTVIVELQD